MIANIKNDKIINVTDIDFDKLSSTEMLQIARFVIKFGKSYTRDGEFDLRKSCEAVTNNGDDAERLLNYIFGDLPVLAKSHEIVTVETRTRDDGESTGELSVDVFDFGENVLLFQSVHEGGQGWSSSALYVDFWSAAAAAIPYLSDPWGGGDYAHPHEITWWGDKKTKIKTHNTEYDNDLLYHKRTDSILPSWTRN